MVVLYAVTSGAFVIALLVNLIPMRAGLRAMVLVLAIVAAIASYLHAPTVRIGPHGRSSSGSACLPGCLRSLSRALFARRAVDERVSPIPPRRNSRKSGRSGGSMPACPLFGMTLSYYDEKADAYSNCPATDAVYAVKGRA